MFGEVIKGQEIVKQIETDYGDENGGLMKERNEHRIEVANCGEIPGTDIYEDSYEEAIEPEV